MKHSENNRLSTVNITYIQSRDYDNTQDSSSTLHYVRLYKMIPQTFFYIMFGHIQTRNPVFGLGYETLCSTSQPDQYT